MKSKSRPLLLCLALSMPLSALACTEPPQTALEHLMESRQLAADLAVQFAKVEEASNRAVMAGSDESSASFAKEARDSMADTDADVSRLRMLIHSLRYAEESRRLDEFDAAFRQYREVDTTVLDLAVQNTNLKAQRLSWGPAAEAAGAFVAALSGLAPASPSDSWKLRALVAELKAGVREMQVLEAPHIAEADDRVMTRLEQQMSRIERDTRTSLAALAPVASAATRDKVAEASRALDRFIVIHAELLKLSRTNSNVRSLALALGQSRNLGAACEATLQSLRKALEERSLGPSR